MPMNPAALGSDIASALSALSDAEKKDVNAIWTKVATLIITHIATNAVVATTGGGGPATGTIS